MSCDDEVLDPGKNIDHWYIDMKSPNQELNFAGLADLCDMVHYGEQILTIAVMAILLTAPLGKLQLKIVVQLETLIVTTLKTIERPKF